MEVNEAAILAQQLFKDNNLTEAAFQFAKSNTKSFDEVVLTLVGLVPLISVQDEGTGSSSRGVITRAVTTTDDIFELHAVRLYLEEVLKQLINTAYKSQRTMISTWLCEIYLHLLYFASLKAGGASRPLPSARKSQFFLADNLPSEADVMSMFKDFLRMYRNVLDAATTVHLLASRNQRALLLFYAQIIGDYDKVVAYFLTENKYSEIIQLLNDAPLERIESLIYKTCPILIEFAPEITVNLLLNKCGGLKFKFLLPVIMRYTEVLDEFIRRTTSGLSGVNCPSMDDFFDDEKPTFGCVLNTDFDGKRVNFGLYFMINYIQRMETQAQFTDSAFVYNTYFWLLMKYDNSEEVGLIGMFKPCVEAMVSASESLTFLQHGVDLNYLLRLSKKFSRARSSVYIYILLNLPQQAVKTALSIDLELAQSVANLPMDPLIQKKLWLLIAEFVLFKSFPSGDTVTALTAQNEGDVKRALALIPISNNVLSIGDVLPYLPEITDISLLKDDICSILEGNVAQIDRVKAEITELSESADNIVKELENIKSRGYNASLMQMCEHCSDELFSKPFYLFPCGHGYHTDCMVNLYIGGDDTDGMNSVLSSNVICNCVLTPTQSSAIRSLSKQIKSLSGKIIKDSINNDKRVVQQLDILVNELDGYIAADCPLCGDLMIRLVGVPLINNGTQQDLLEAKSWDL